MGAVLVAGALVASAVLLVNGNIWATGALYVGAKLSGSGGSYGRTLLSSVAVLYAGAVLCASDVLYAGAELYASADVELYGRLAVETYAEACLSVDTCDSREYGSVRCRGSMLIGLAKKFDADGSLRGVPEGMLLVFGSCIFRKSSSMSNSSSLAGRRCGWLAKEQHVSHYSKCCAMFLSGSSVGHVMAVSDVMRNTRRILPLMLSFFSLSRWKVFLWRQAKTNAGYLQ